MPTIALATYASLPKLYPDEHPLIEALVSLGVSAVPPVWDYPSVEWGRFDGVVIRSCWDYHLRPGEFFAWVTDLSARRTPVWNPPALLRWNSRRRICATSRPRTCAPCRPCGSTVMAQRTRRDRSPPSSANPR